VEKIWLKQTDFCKIWLAKKNFRLIFGSAEFYVTNKNPTETSKIYSPPHNEFG